MNKESWIRLAQAMADERGWMSELYEAKTRLAKKHGGSTDFIGNDYFDGPVVAALEDILGDDFCYWLYDCDGSFAAFRDRVTNADGSHPNVDSLESLYDYAFQGDEEIKRNEADDNGRCRKCGRIFMQLNERQLCELCAKENLG